MNKFIVAALIACGCAGQVSAGDSSDVAALKQLGQDMGDAMIAGDIDKLDRMFADDWVSIGMSGKTTDKQAMLAGYRAGKCKLVWFELGPMDVQVVGNTAAVHGSVTEKRCDAKAASGRFLYTDLLERRENRWVVVRSAGLEVK